MPHHEQVIQLLQVGLEPADVDEFEPKVDYGCDSTSIGFSALLADGESCMNDEQCVSENCGEDMTCSTPGSEAMCMP